jgi:hypothetical protein
MPLSGHLSCLPWSDARTSGVGHNRRSLPDEEDIEDVSDTVFWIDRLLEFLGLRGPSRVTSTSPAPTPARVRSHGLRTSTGRPAANHHRTKSQQSKSQKETA